MMLPPDTYPLTKLLQPTSYAASFSTSNTVITAAAKFNLNTPPDTTLHTKLLQQQATAANNIITATVNCPIQSEYNPTH